MSATSTIDVLEAGSYDSTRYGKFEITTSQLDEMVSEFNESQAHGRRPVDFDHPGPTDKTVAAGWIQGLHRDGDKLRADVEWTDLGVEAVTSKRYKFQSAEFSSKKRSKVDGTIVDRSWMKAVTLTNRPFIETMDPISLSDDPDAPQMAVYQSSLADVQSLDWK